MLLKGPNILVQSGAGQSAWRLRTGALGLIAWDAELRYFALVTPR
jgi:hypothetical protein